jgi:hypothetical protein
MEILIFTNDFIYNELNSSVVTGYICYIYSNCKFTDTNKTFNLANLSTYYFNNKYFSKTKFYLPLIIFFLSKDIFIFKYLNLNNLLKEEYIFLSEECLKCHGNLIAYIQQEHFPKYSSTCNYLTEELYISFCKIALSESKDSLKYIPTVYHKDLL